jgi:hypothetical protein
MSDPLRAMCHRCALGIPVPREHQIAVVRCVRLSADKNPLDCCRFFLPPPDVGNRYVYPLGSPREAGATYYRRRTDPIMKFDPRTGLQVIES